MALPVDVVRSSASLGETKRTLRSVFCKVVTGPSRKVPTGPVSTPARHRSHVPAWHRAALALFSLRYTAPDFFSLHGNAPAAVDSILTQGMHLHRENLLIQHGDTRIECSPQHFRRFACVAKALFVFTAKNPSALICEPHFTGIFRMSDGLAEEDPFRPARPIVLRGG
jgi:hypothetical protein